LREILNTVVLLASVERLAGVQQRNVDLHRFAANSEVLSEIKSALNALQRAGSAFAMNVVGAIPSRRLEAVPWAHSCVLCQYSFERSATQDGANAQSVFSTDGKTRTAAGVSSTS
jgi:RNA polymerase-binding transcription factor DksA